MLENIWRKGTSLTLLECIELLWRIVWRFLLKLGIKLPYDPAIPLLSINPKKTTLLEDTCTPVFIVTLFTTVKTWNQPRCPSIEERVEKNCGTYTQGNITPP